VPGGCANAGDFLSGVRPHSYIVVAKEERMIVVVIRHRVIRLFPLHAV
jgi:hypothetical protein